MIKPISFGKTLVATCKLKCDNDNSLPCKIYELDNVQDKDYFSNLKSDTNWSGNRFVWVMNRLMNSRSIGNDNDTFSIENEIGDCLGYINVITHEKPHNRKSIQYLETSPQLNLEKDDKTSEIVAKSLVSLIVQQAQNECRDKVSVLAFDAPARRFFGKKCGFKLGTEGCYDYILETKSYPKFKDKFSKEIEFII